MRATWDHLTWLAACSDLCEYKRSLQVAV